MVAKRRKQNPSKQTEKKGRVKVGKLKLNKETVRDLTTSESKAVRGGQAVAQPRTCNNTTVVAGRVSRICVAGGGGGQTGDCSN
jgi:hypothetical protein